MGRSSKIDANETAAEPWTVSAYAISSYGSHMILYVKGFPPREGHGISQYRGAPRSGSPQLATPR